MGLLLLIVEQNVLLLLISVIMAQLIHQHIMVSHLLNKRESSQTSCTGASASDCTQVLNLNTVTEFKAKTYDGAVTNCVYGICAVDTITSDTSSIFIILNE